MEFSSFICSKPLFLQACLFDKVLFLTGKTLNFLSNTVHDLIEKTFLQKSGFKSLKEKPLPRKIEFKYVP